MAQTMSKEERPQYETLLKELHSSLEETFEELASLKKDDYSRMNQEEKNEISIGQEKMQLKDENSSKRVIQNIHSTSILPHRHTNC